MSPRRTVLRYNGRITMRSIFATAGGTTALTPCATVLARHKPSRTRSQLAVHCVLGSARRCDQHYKQCLDGAAGIATTTESWSTRWCSGQANACLAIVIWKLINLCLV